MNSTYITEETIEALLPKLRNQVCSIEGVTEERGVSVYELSVGGVNYRIRRNDAGELIRKRLLPSSIARLLRDYAYKQAFRRARS